MTQTTEERLQTLETMADQAVAYAKVSRRLVMALGALMVERADDPLRLIDELRERSLDDAEPQAFRDQIEHYLAFLEAIAERRPPRG